MDPEEISEAVDLVLQDGDQSYNWFRLRLIVLKMADSIRLMDSRAGSS